MGLTSNYFSCMDLMGLWDYCLGFGARLLIFSIFIDIFNGDLRTYPYRFGLRILRILGDLQKTGCRTFPETPKDFNALECYKGQDFNDIWTDAGMDLALEYLYGNRHLKVPLEWKPHLLPQISQD